MDVPVEDISVEMKKLYILTEKENYVVVNSSAFETNQYSD